MEKLVNCNLIIDIKTINRISGGAQKFEVFFISGNDIKYKIDFESVWDMRYSIESGCIDRFAKFKRTVNKTSSILAVDNSSRISYFKKQSSGTRPTEKLKEYILFDEVDTVISLLSASEPILMEI